MSLLIAILLLAALLALFVYCFNQLLKGDTYAILLFAIIFFPVYTVFLIINYQGFASKELLSAIQYLKELLVFTGVLMVLFGRSNVIQRQWQTSKLDWLFLLFLSLALVYALLPIGEATFVNKAVYYKNLLLIGSFYFLGRNSKFILDRWQLIFKCILSLIVLAAFLVVIEKVLGRHLHGMIGMAEYLTDVFGREPQGPFGLPWTFSNENEQPRYGSFYAHPLELSASMLVGGSLAIIYLLSVPYRVNKTKYLLILACAFIGILFAYSRAAFAAFFLMLVYIAFLKRYYSILKIGFVTFLVITVYVFFLAPDSTRYFVIDTLTFQNSSSLTHIVEWVEAIESMSTNPLGIGLAMSGNGSGVERDLQVGGENQFLVLGVQLGVFGMLLYILMIYYGIRNSWKAFRRSKDMNEAIIPFVAGSVKFGLLLPLFTANAEVYIYVSLVSWWMIGASESIYQSYRKTVWKTQFGKNVSMNSTLKA